MKKVKEKGNLGKCLQLYRMQFCLFVCLFPPKVEFTLQEGRVCTLLAQCISLTTNKVPGIQ